MRRTSPCFAIPLAVALAGCGSDSQQAPAPPPQSPTSQAATAEPAEPAKGPSPQVFGDVDCTKLPNFVGLPGDAAIDGCFISEASPTFGGGSVMYKTRLSREALVAWYRDKARASGMSDHAETGIAYAARDGEKRSIDIKIRSADASGTVVTLNWKHDE